MVTVTNQAICHKSRPFGNSIVRLKFKPKCSWYSTVCRMLCGHGPVPVHNNVCLRITANLTSCGRLKNITTSLSPQAKRIFWCPFLKYWEYPNFATFSQKLHTSLTYCTTWHYTTMQSIHTVRSLSLTFSLRKFKSYLTLWWIWFKYHCLFILCFV